MKNIRVSYEGKYGWMQWIPGLEQWAPLPYTRQATEEQVASALFAAQPDVHAIQFEHRILPESISPESPWPGRAKRDHETHKGTNKRN